MLKSKNIKFYVFLLLVFIFSFLFLNKFHIINSSPVYNKVIIFQEKESRESRSKIATFQEAYNSVYNKEQDKQYSKITEEAKNWWTKQLGFNPWTSPVKILWSSDLEDGVLGLTTTPIEYNSLTDLEWGSYIQIDNERIISTYGKEKEEEELLKVLTHEMGHYLGLEHITSDEKNIMNKYNENTNFVLNDYQKNKIKELK